MSTERKLLALQRSMAWERAKGELNSMLHTYYSIADGTKFEDFNKLLKEFVESVEENGLQE